MANARAGRPIALGAPVSPFSASRRSWRGRAPRSRLRRRRAAVDSRRRDRSPRRGGRRSRPRRRGSRCSGPSRPHEKDVALAIAHAPARPHRTRPEHARDADARRRFLRAAARARQKSRRVQADLFVSIDADSSSTGSARRLGVRAHENVRRAARRAGWRTARTCPTWSAARNVHAKDATVLRTLIDVEPTAQIKDSLKLGGEVLGEIAKVGKLHRAASSRRLRGAEGARHSVDPRRVGVHLESGPRGQAAPIRNTAPSWSRRSRPASSATSRAIRRWRVRASCSRRAPARWRISASRCAATQEERCFIPMPAPCSTSSRRAACPRPTR